MANPIELLISLGINSAESKRNIQNYIDKLKLEDLDVTINVKNSSSSNKVLKQMDEQLENVIKGLDSLGKRLESIGTQQKKLKFKINTQSIENADELLEEFLKDLKSAGNDYKVNFTYDKNGERKVKDVIASIKDELGEVQTVRFKMDKQGNFNEIFSSEQNTAAKNFKKITNDINDAIKSMGRNGTVSAERLNEIVNKVSKINNQDITLDEKVAKLQRVLKGLNGEFSELQHQNKMKQAMNSAEQSIQSLESSYKKTINTYRREAKKVDVSQWKRQIEDLKRSLPLKFVNEHEAKAFNNEINRVKGNLRDFNAQLTSANRSSVTLGEALRTAFTKFPIWMIASTAFFGAINGLKSMVEEILTVDKAMTNLKRVMDAAPQTYNYMLQESIALSKELGNNVHDVMESLNEVARSYGENMTPDEMLAVTKTSMLAANVSDLTAEDAMNSLIGTMNAFKITANESIQIVDKMNEVDNNFSITTAQLSDAMAKSAGVAKVYGISIDELIGNITSIGAVTMESGSIIGRSLKTIYSRITTLNKAKDSLSAVGVSITDMQGQVKPVSDILGELAGKWNKLSDAQRQQVAVDIAGRDQLTRLIALMENWDMGMQATNVSLNSQNSAMEENAKYQQSLEARLNSLKTTFTETSLAIGEAVLTDGFIGMVEMLESIATFGGKVAGSIGVLPILFGGVSVALIMLNKSFMSSVTQMGLFSAATVGLKTAVTSLSVSIKGLLASTGVGLVFAGIGFGLEFLIKKFSESSRATEEFEIQQKQLMDTYKENRDSLGSLIEEYDKLDKKLSSGNYTSEDLERHSELAREISTLMPNLIITEDEYGRKIIGSSERIKAKTKWLEKQLAIQEKIDAIQKQEEVQETYDTTKENLNDNQNKLDDMNAGVMTSTGLKQMEYFYKKREEFQNKLASGRKLDVMEQNNLEFYDLQIQEYEKLQVEVENARVLYQQALMDMIDTNVKLDDSTSATTKSLISDFTTFVAVAEGISDDTMNGIFDGVLDSLKNDKEFKSTLNEYSVAVKEYQDKINSGTIDATKLQEYEDKVTTSFDNVKTALTSVNGMGKLNEDATKKIIAGLESTSNAAFVAGVDFIKLSESTGLSTDKIREQLGITGDAEDSLDEYGDIAEEVTESVEEAADALEEYITKLKELSSAQEQIVGVSESLVSETEDLIYVYQSLSNQSNLNETQQKQLASAIEHLSALYPHLVENGELRIDQIAEENNANKVLLEAYELASDGKLTAEQEMTLAQANGTKARIDNIKKEIEALETYRQALQKVMSETAEAINNAADGDSLDTLRQESRYYRAESSYIATGSSLQGKIDELDALQGQLKSNIGTIDTFNKSMNDSSSSQSSSNSTTKDSIYYTDKYKKALEALNLEIEKQQSLREGEVDSSEKYRKSLEAQIKLEQQKLKLQQDQAKALDAQIKSGKIQQTGSVSIPSSTTTTKSSYASGGSSEATIWNFFKSKGFSDSIVAGIMGNLKMESNFNSSAVNPSSGAYGIAQWLGGRKSGLSSYANSLGTSMSDLSTQLNYLWKELNGSEKKTLNWINSNPNASASQMAAMFDKLFERSEGTHIPQRQNYANQILSKYSGTGVSSVSIDSTGQAIDTTQQAIDDAQSSLLSLKSDILSQQNLIAELEQQIIESNLAYFESRRSSWDREIDYETAKLQELDTNSSRYAQTLELMKNYMNQKQRANKDELKYLQQQINSGKLSNAMLETMQIRYKELTTEIKSLSIELQQMDYDIIINIKTQGDEKIDDIEYQMSRLQSQRNLFDEGSADYVASMEKEIALQKQQTQQYLNQINAIKEQLRYRDLNASQIKEFSEILEDLTLSYHDSIAAEKSLAEAMKQSQEDLVNSVADNLINAYKEYVDERKEEHMKAIDDEREAEEKLHDQRVKQLEDEMDLYRKSVQEKLDLIDKKEADRDYNMEMADLQKERNELERLINLQSMDTSNEGKAKLNSLQKDLDAVNKEISEKQHDRNIQIQKDTLNESLASKEEEVNGLLEIEDERYEAVTKTIDREKEYWEKHYNDLLNSEREHQRIKDQIVSEGFDSLSTEFQGYINEMESTMPSLENTLNGTMKGVGTSIRENVIDNLKEAMNLLSEFQDGQSVSSVNTNTGNTGSTKGLTLSDMQVMLAKYMSDELTTKETNSTRKQNIYDKAHSLAAVGRNGDSTISSSMGFDEIISTLSGAQLTQFANYMIRSADQVVSTSYLQDYIKNYAQQLLASGASLNKGGMTNWKGLGIDDKGGKLIIAHPNEIINNPIDTERLLQTSSIMERVANFIKPISSSVLKGINSVTSQPIIVQFGDVIGATPQQADNFATKFISDVKRKGGKI